METHTQRRTHPGHVDTHTLSLVWFLHLFEYSTPFTELRDSHAADWVCILVWQPSVCVLLLCLGAKKKKNHSGCKTPTASQHLVWKLLTAKNSASLK